MKEKDIILIVDDNVANLKVLSDFFKETDYDILFASNGTSGISITESELPDLILLDIQMPDLDGFEVCTALKNNEETQDIPIIFITALSDKESKLKAFEVGGVDYITKPFDVEEVLARVSTHLTIRHLRLSLEKEVKAKTKALSMASHEIRRPLTMISMVAQLIERKHDSIVGDQLVGFMKDVHAASDRVVKLLDEFLLMAKGELNKELYNPVLFDIGELLRGVIKEIGQSSGESNRISYISFSEQIWAKGDNRLLYQVFDNLLSNALKYSDEMSPVELLCELGDNELIVSVKDFGIGIPDNHLDSLFNEFSRADNVGTIEGNGLGLAIVKQFVALHNGDVAVESTLDVGTTFVVKLPILVKQ